MPGSQHKRMISSPLDPTSPQRVFSYSSAHAHLLAPAAPALITLDVESLRKTRENQPQALPWATSMKHLLTDSSLNVLLVFIPLVLLSQMFFSDAMTFTFAFLGLVPLAAGLGTITEDISLRTGQAGSALINLTFGNFTEMVISIVALMHGMNDLVKMSLMGSVLSNMLLTFGGAILVGSSKRHEVKFNANALGTYCVLLTMSTLGLIIPSCYGSMEGKTEVRLLELSRFMAFCMVFCYMAFLYFQLRSHADFFEDADDCTNGESGEDAEGSDEVPQLPVPLAVALLGIFMVLISWLSDQLVATLQPTAVQLGCSEAFIGFILVPLIGNAAEMATALLMAHHDKMGIACGVAVGSSIQVSLFVYPVMVLASWMLNGTLDLNLRMYTTVAVFLSVIVVTVIVQDGKTNWLEGLFLLVAYIMVGVTYMFVSPKDAR
eukprot:NODE_487_length_2192_cov_30.676155_g447_i0.p1 GENE.NODE_487_length_2192_cov_30.676155_g447_i0~~NODE_487_length_2192_cov_30.676155_g447_i0.p1  ORF type:complete len:434 (+),score=83.07 NODE_487_length_2192_cov_30.676155_g447_i0:123-1424(+)